MTTYTEIVQQVHEGIDAQDATTMANYVDHCLDNLDNALLGDLFMALLKGDEPGEKIAILRLYSRIDRQRAEFTEMEAARLLKELEALEDARHEAAN